jgi:uncharacterized protein (TIGR01244 family)
VKQRYAVPALLGALLLMTVCQRSLDRFEPGVPVVLSGWSGVNRIARDGPLFFAGQPDRAVLVRLAEEEGVRLVVNLRTGAEMAQLIFDERVFVEELGLEYVHLPCPAGGLARETVDQFAEVLAGTPGPVLLHCFVSRRVGALWMAYLALHRDRDLDTAREAGRAAGLNSAPLMDAVLEMIAER